MEKTKESTKEDTLLGKAWNVIINAFLEVADQEVQKHFGKNLEELLNHFMAKVNSEFERQCLVWYFVGKGQKKEVSPEVFQRIAKAAVESRAASEKRFHGPRQVTIDGKIYYSQTISFYEYDEFDYALGCSTIFFDEKGVPVGLRDRYDFNEAKHRDTDAEKDTTFMDKLEQDGLAKSYDIVYGIHDLRD